METMQDVNNLYTQPKKRLTLGYLNFYHNPIMKGISDAALEHDINVLIFSHNQTIELKDFDRQIKTMLELIKHQNLDGLMFIGWIQLTGLNIDDIAKALDPLPLFSLGTGFPHIPHVYMDGTSYVRELLIHLIEVHGCRRIVMVPPILWDPRVQIYVDVMKEYGIYDSKLLLDVEQLRAEGLEFELRAQKALSILLDEQRISFDAIASTYNSEAVAIINNLKKRAIDVPGSVKVIGYEDKELGKYVSPALTTIYYPFWEIGYYGCKCFIERLSTSNDVPFSTAVPGRVILRQSCGCTTNSLNLTEITRQETIARPILKLTGRTQKKIYARMKKYFPIPDFSIKRVIAAFFASIKAGTNEVFLHELEQQWLIFHEQGNDISLIEDFLSSLRRLIFPYLATQPSDLLRMETLLHQARVVLKEALIGFLGYQENETNTLNLLLNKFYSNLFNALDTNKILDVLELSLPKLGLASCLLFLFTSDRDPFKSSILAFKYIENKRVDLPANLPCPLQNFWEQLLTDGRRYTLLCQILGVSDEQIGLVLFETGQLAGEIFNLLSVQLSSALKGAILLEKLENANREIVATQQELISKAHKAGMADITNGALHNIGNILDSIETSISQIQAVYKASPLATFLQANDLLVSRIQDSKTSISEIREGTNDNEVLQHFLDLEPAFSEQKKQTVFHLEKLNEKINLINEIIAAQQHYAGAKPLFDEVNLAELIEDALRMQSDFFEEDKIEIVKNFMDIPKISVQKTKLLHVLINIFKNAREAMENPSVEQRKLIITLEQDTESISVRIEDTGCGIATPLLEHIFISGFTTKEAGHGLGLHSCANYMTEMNGKIWAESPGPNKGATFILKFPKNTTERPV